MIASRLIEIDGQSCSWDNNGNFLSDGSRTFTYDTANRLTSVTQGSDVTSFVYNGDGDRYAQTVNGIRTDYMLDPVGLAQVLVETQGGQSNFYMPGLGQYSGSNWQYFAPDRLGSVRQIVGPAGQLALTQSFDPFGNVLEQTGAGSSVFGYTGEQVDANGLVYLRARYYDPRVGRFLTADSIIPDPTNSQSWNRYAYVDNNPIRYVDPSGHQGEPWEEAVRTVRNWVCGGWLSVNECPMDTFIRVTGILPSPSKITEEIQEHALNTPLLINPEDAEEIRQALDAVDTAADLAPLISQLGGCLDPNDIRYSQETYTAGPRPIHGTDQFYTVEENAVTLMNNPDEDLPGGPIRIFVKEEYMNKWGTVKTNFGVGDPKNLENGQIYTLDHGRLAAYRMAGRETIPVRLATQDEIERDIFKFTTPNYGTEIFPRE